MFCALRSEFYTFYKKLYVLIISLIIVLPTLWYFGTSYKNLYYTLEENIVYIEEAEQAIQEFGVEYDFSVDYMNLLDIISVINPGNAVNNILMVQIGIGLLIFPMLFALFIGSEYSNHQIELKEVTYGVSNVIFSKIIVLISYLAIMVTALTGAGYFIANHYWKLYSDTISAAGRYVEIPNQKINYSLIILTLIILCFYSLLVFMISFMARNSVAGIIANVVIVYGEGYIMNSAMPKWIFYHLLNNNITEYENSFVSFAVSDKVANLGTGMSVVLILVYFVCIIAGIKIICKRK